MICPRCGASTREMSCPYCGTSLRSGIENEEYRFADTSEEETERVPAMELSGSDDENMDTGIYESDTRSRLTSLILAIFYGYLGIHHFYNRRWKFGILYFFTMGLMGAGWIFDIVSIAIGKYRDADRRLVTEWPMKENDWKLLAVLFLIFFLRLIL